MLKDSIEYLEMQVAFMKETAHKTRAVGKEPSDAFKILLCRKAARLKELKSEKENEIE